MKIKIDSQYKVTKDFDILGYMGETNSRIIDVIQPCVNDADTYKLRFEYRDGEVYNVPIRDNKVVITASLLREVGIVNVQWTASRTIAGEYILVAKSRVFQLAIKPSIRDDYIPVPPSTNKIERILAALERALATYNNKKTSAYDATMIHHNYDFDPVVLRIPGSVEYVKDDAYSINYRIRDLQTGTNGTYSSSTGEKLFVDGVEIPHRSIRHLILEDGVKQIGDGAFSGHNKLDRIEFPESLEWVHSRAFENTEWEQSQPLGEVYCGNVLYRYKYESSVYQNSKSYFYPQEPIVRVRKGTKSISSKAFLPYQSYPSDSNIVLGVKRVELPDGILGVGDYAFYNVNYSNPSNSSEKNLHGGFDINLPDSIVWVGDYAFSNSYARIDQIPPNLADGIIREYSFHTCNFVNGLKIPDNIKWIKRYGLNSNNSSNTEYCSTIEFGSGLKRIDDYGINLCGVKELLFPEGIEWIGVLNTQSGNAYLKHVYLPSSLKYVGFEIPSCVTKVDIGDNFYADLNLRNASSITAENAREIIGKLADRTNLKQGTIRLYSSIISQLPSNVISEATNKNWLVTSS